MSRLARKGGSFIKGTAAADAPPSPGTPSAGPLGALSKETLPAASPAEGTNTTRTTQGTRNPLLKAQEARRRRGMTRQSSRHRIANGARVKSARFQRLLREKSMRAAQAAGLDWFSKQTQKVLESAKASTRDLFGGVGGGKEAQRRRDSLKPRFAPSGQRRISKTKQRRASMASSTAAVPPGARRTSGITQSLREQMWGTSAGAAGAGAARGKRRRRTRAPPRRHGARGGATRALPPVKEPQSEETRGGGGDSGAGK